MINSDDLEAFGYYNETKQDHFTVKEDTASRKTIAQMVDEFAVTMGQEPDTVTSFRLIEEEFEELCGFFSDVNDDWKSPSELKELADLVYVIYGYARVCGYNLDEAIRRVHENNMQRCIWPDGSVHRREDGKILRNPGVKSPYLGDLIK